MKIKEATIITLENNEQYIILNELINDNKHYFLATGFDDEKKIDSSKVTILEEEIEEDKVYVRIIKEPELLQKLASLFKMQME